MKKKTNKNLKMPLIEALKKYGDKNSVRFHIPGHKGRERGRIASALRENLYNWDVTEIPGLDDLHQPRGPIKNAQKKLAKLYGADHSFFLLNGATSGVIAMMGAALRPGDEVLISRASHKSILSGLILTGARPVYIMPEVDEKLGVFTQVTPKNIAKAIEANPDVKAVLITNPVYQGFCPDIQGISRVIEDKNIVFLVDEAHGPHFGFSPLLPIGAGHFADAWVQSPHKVLASFTQSAWLHIKGERIDKNRLGYFLQLVTTTSPSYIMMASLDYTRALMEYKGRILTEKALQLAESARRRINKVTPFYCVGPEILGQNGIYDIDLSRLMVNVSQAGYTGYEIDEFLRQRFKIFAEYADFYNVYFLISFLNTKRDIRQLVKALASLRQRSPIGEFKPLLGRIPKKALEPREAFNYSSESILLQASQGRICGQALVLYPPGVPLVMPGEIIEKQHIEILTDLLNSGGACQGVTSGGSIIVLK